MIEAIHSKSDFSADDLSSTRQHYYMSLLEMLVIDQPMEATLKHLIEQIENEHHGAIASILFLSEDGKYLLNGIGPNLPQSYMDAVNGIAIGEAVGSCGAAAATGKCVIVEDISSHPYWADYKSLALDAGLAACWSQPIVAEGKVLGTFAIYYPEPRSPTNDDIVRIKDASKLAQVVIERSRQKLQNQLSTQVFDRSKQAIIVSNADSIVTYANPEACRICGYSQQQILNLIATSLNCNGENHTINQQIAAALVSEGTWQGELQYHNRLGEHFYLDQTISVQKVDGVITQYVSVFNDITEKKLTEQALSKNTLQLELALASAKMGYWEWNLETNDFVYNGLWGNHPPSSALNVANEHVSVDAWSASIHPEDISKTQDAVAAYLKKQTPTLSYEQRVLNKDQQYQWLHISGRSLEIDDNGKVISMVGIVQDCDEVKNLTLTLEKKVAERTKELTQAKHVAESANRAKSEFLAVMTHELRTPLNSIIGLSQLVRDMELQPQQKDFIDKVCTSADMLLELINQILDYSKIEANETEIENKPFYINQTLEKINDILEHKAKHKNIRFKLENQELTNSLLLGDGRALLQVLLNLTNNAIKFTQQGSVTLLVEKISEDDQQRKIRFSVIDTGIGIEKEKQRLLFKPFSQVDNGLSRNFEGTGLGLSISQRLVNMMGGEITYKSNFDQGSNFSFELSFKKITDDKCVKAAQPDTRRFSKTSCNGCADSRVLLVEDNEFNQVFATALLKKFGIDPVIASNGEIALELINNNSFDLVLMDISMPVMDGITATEQIRKRWDSNALPIIAMTANVSATHRKRAIDAGMNGFINKPVRVEQLLITLQTWLDCEVT